MKNFRVISFLTLLVLFTDGFACDFLDEALEKELGFLCAERPRGNRPSRFFVITTKEGDFAVPSSYRVRFGDPGGFLALHPNADVGYNSILNNPLTFSTPVPDKDQEHLTVLSQETVQLPACSSTVRFTSFEHGLPDGSLKMEFVELAIGSLAITVPKKGEQLVNGLLAGYVSLNCTNDNKSGQ
jgi:hypothetical protein